MEDSTLQVSLILNEGWEDGNVPWIDSWTTSMAFTLFFTSDFIKKHKETRSIYM